MKTHVITVSKTFLNGHSRAGQFTHFKEKILAGEKIHTIRGNFDYWAPKIQEVMDGKAILSIREWIDKPYKKPGQREITRLDASSGIGFQEVFLTNNITLEMSINDKYCYVLEDKIYTKDGLLYFDFLEWFFPQKSKKDSFKGIIIHFTKYRY